MILLMAFAAVVAVTQLTVLASWSRTLRLGTLLQAVALGFLVCAPVTAALQWLVTRGVALVVRQPIGEVVRFASWTYDPLLEEVLKLVPLVLLVWRFRRIHAQLGWTDHLLAGAALGTGFALCEAALRYARLGIMAMPTQGGFIVAGGLFGMVVVPSIWTSLTTWLPQPAAFQDWFSATDTAIQHLVWSALAATGLAFFVRFRGRLRWLGAVPLLIVTIDHCNGNADAALVPRGWLAWPLDRLGDALPTLLVLTLLVSVVLDRRVLARARAGRPELLLTGEGASGLDPRPMLTAALRKVPWSTWSTWQLVLERRAALNAHDAGLPAPHLADQVRDSVELLGRATDADRWTAAGRTLLSALDLRGVLLNWRTMLWLAAMLPGVAFLIVGGFPATRPLQGWMTGWVGAALAAAGLVAGGVLVVAQFPGWVRGMRTVTEPALHEARLRPALRVATASAVLTTGVTMLALLAFTRDPAHRIVTNFHVLDALSNASLMLGLAILLLSFLLFPPGAALLVTTAGTVVLTGSGIALMTGTLIGTTLISQGLLQMASGGGSSSSGSGSSGRPARPGQSDWERSSVDSGRFTEADLSRLRELAKDADKGGKVTKGSWEEAEVGLGLEKKGLVSGLQRGPRGTEFIDRARQTWDVKAFRSFNFKLDDAMTSIRSEITSKNNVMLDTRNLTAEQFGQLDDAIRAAGLEKRVLWWP